MDLVDKYLGEESPKAFSREDAMKYVKNTETMKVYKQQGYKFKAVEHPKKKGMYAVKIHCKDYVTDEKNM